MFLRGSLEEKIWLLTGTFAIIECDDAISIHWEKLKSFFHIERFYENSFFSTFVRYAEKSKCNFALYGWHQKISLEDYRYNANRVHSDKKRFHHRLQRNIWLQELIDQQDSSKPWKWCYSQDNVKTKLMHLTVVNFYSFSRYSLKCARAGQLSFFFWWTRYQSSLVPFTSRYVSHLMQDLNLRNVITKRSIVV